MNISFLQRFALFIVLCFAAFIVINRSELIKLKAEQVESYFNVPISSKEHEVVSATLGDAALNLMISDTEEKRERGLGGRGGISYKQGMIFMFPYPGKHGIWMKDMIFPIDILWFDENMQVIYMEENIEPNTFPQVFNPPTIASYVVEVRAGFIEKYKIKIGSTLVLYK